MKNRRRIPALLLAGLMLAASLTACGGVDDVSPITTSNRTLFATLKPPSIATSADTSLSSELTSLAPTTTTPAPVTTAATTTRAPVTTAPPPPEPAYPTFNDLVGLTDYLAECRENDELAPIFRYTGDRNAMWGQNYADLLGTFYTRISHYGGKLDTYQLKITEYPGDRMLDAYRSGDRSALTDDEEKALDKAIGIVAQAKEESDSDIELEILLHDWICDNVSYSTAGTNVPDYTDPPRHLTAVGALLDGSVNCQGYTDAFYLLASMAGFTVSRQAGMTATGAHIFNTLKLGGEWVIVDVCHDDTSIDNSGKGISDYRYLNAGRDLCKHTWTEEQEINPISADSGSDYYYYAHDLAFDEVDEVARTIVEGWTEAGQTEFYLMLEDQNTGWETLNPILSDYLNQTGRAYNFTTWHSFQGENTYFYVIFQ